MAKKRYSLLDHALAYARRGWRVLPLHSVHSGDCSCGRDACTSVGKHPRTKNGVKDATTDPEQLRHWWQSWPEANIGLATGQGLYVIDLDTAKGASLEATAQSPYDFAALLATTLAVRTGSGGYHLYLECDPALALPNTAGKLGPFIDTRGEGGYVVAPPSRNRQGPYRWLEGPTRPASIPAELVRQLTGSNDKEHSHEISRPADATPAPASAAGANAASAEPVNSIAQEARNTFLIRQIGRWRVQGRNLEEIRALVLALNETRYGQGRHPQGPLSREEIEATLLKSAAKWEKLGGVPTDPQPRIITLDHLLSQQYPPLVWVVPNLLPEGLALLAGKQKLGKSWLALGLALTCASGSANDGRRVLGRYEVEPSGVLYIALEDHERRLQNRVRQVLAERTPRGRFDLALSWPLLRSGGFGELEAYLLANPSTQLVIIDTLQKVRGEDKRGGSMYQQDYALMGELQQMALRYHVVILVLHHTRKMPGDDAYDEVSGSTGLTGAADTSLVVQRKRTERAGVLHLTGRDVEEQELVVDFDPATCTWTITGNAAEQRETRPISPRRQEILDLLGEQGGMTLKQIEQELGRAGSSLRSDLFRLTQDGVIVRNGRGYYALPSSTLPLGKKDGGEAAD